MTLKIKTECIEVVFDDEGINTAHSKFNVDYYKRSWDNVIAITASLLNQCSAETIKIKESQKWKSL